jgi:hypothetical protein
LLLKALYGSVQASRLWGKHYAEIMKKIGFHQSKSDPCLFVRQNERGLAMVAIYIDDGYACGDRAALDQMIEQLQAAKLKLKVEHSMEDYLSCQVLFSKDGSKAWLGQPHMIKKIVKTFEDDVKGLKVFKTPGTPGYIVPRPQEDDPVVSDDLQARYRSSVGMLLYLVKHSRPDISNAVRELTKCMDKASPEAFKEMLRVVKFVLDTRTMGLRLEPDMTGGDKLVWKLVLYSDSDWAGDKQTRKSVAGFVMFLCGVPIMWRSRQMKAVTLSSTEAEYYAVSEAVKEILFVVQVLMDMGIAVETPILVRVDNMGAVYMTANPSSSSRTRHVDTRWHFVRELAEQGLVEILFVKTEDNLSDGQTKNVTGEVYGAHTGNYVMDKSEID